MKILNFIQKNGSNPRIFVGPSASELQSAVSLVDSASNYIEEDEQQLEDEEEGPLPDTFPISYAEAVRHSTAPTDQVFRGTPKLGAGQLGARKFERILT
jgi:hypothetical protein